MRTTALLGASWLALAGAAAAQQEQGPPAGTVSEDPRDALIRQLQERLTALEAQVAELKARSQAGVDDVRRIVTEQPEVTLHNARPQIATRDEQFSFALRSIVQLDAASYDQGDPPVPDNRNAGSTTSEGPAARDLNSGTIFRRARLGFQGTAFRDWNYAMIVDFGETSSESPTLYQAWLEYAGWKPFGSRNPVRLRAGAYTWPTGLDDATSSADLIFLERGAAANLVRDLAGGSGRVGAGILAHGSRWNASAAITGAEWGDTGDFDEQTAAVARLDGLAFHSEHAALHVGANVSRIFQLPDTTPPGTPGPWVIDLRERPELRVDGTRLIDTGDIPAEGVLAYGVELGAHWRYLLATGEVYWIDVDRVGLLPNADFGGWYVQGSWVLTGEQRRWNAERGGFGGVRPKNPFNPSQHHWGAFELAARYSVLDLNYNEGVLGEPPPFDGIRGGQQDIVTLGLNWYPNSVIRFLLGYQFVDVDRLNPSSAIFTTIPPNGAQIGQDYRVVSLRSQFAF